MHLRKNYIRYLDKLWSTTIFIRDDGICQYNKLAKGIRKEGREAHHLFSRKNVNTRWNLDNGILLAGAHHYSKAHLSPEDFRQFLIEKWFKSEEKYKNLHIASCLVFKQDMGLWEFYLLKELSKLLKRDVFNEFIGLSLAAKIKKLKEIKQPFEGVE